MRDRCGLVRLRLAVCVSTVLSLVACTPATEPKRPQAVDARDASTPVAGAIGRLPLAFEPNSGQAPAEVRYVGRGTRYRLWLTSTEARFTAPASRGREAPTIRLRLVGAAPASRVAAEDRLPGTVNYFVGRDPAGWRRHVPTYGRVVYHGVYPSVDLVFHGDQRDAEFDFVLAPGADPRVIGVELDGAEAVTLDGGDVVARAGEAELRLRQPAIYQERDGRRDRVPGRFALHGRRIAFEVGDYDRARPLVIDPVVSYSSYLGGAGFEAGRGIGVDAAGNIYAVADGLGVVKLSADGARLLYSTVLGDAELVALAVDAGGHAYVAGNFPKPRSGVSGVYPVTANALQPTFGAACNQGDVDGVMAKLSPDGAQLLYSSFVGGRCTYLAHGIAVDGAGNFAVVGEGSITDSYPATRPPFASGPGDAPGWIQVVAADFSHYVYSALILAGEGAQVSPTAVAMDGTGNAYVTGTAGPGLPTTPGVPQRTATNGAAFLAKIAADGSRLVYATYFGNAETVANAVTVDAGGSAYLAGQAGAGLPAVNALQSALAGGADAFVAKLDTAGSSVVFATYLGGRADDAAVGIGVDATGTIYVAGPTDSTDFPQRNALPASAGAPGSNFVAALTPSGSALVYSTYFGTPQTFVDALAVTSSGSVYLTGSITATGLATVRPRQATYGGGTSDAFIARIDSGTAAGTLRVFITAPAAGATVSGTVWTTIWIENAAAGSRTFTLSEGTAVAASTTSTSNGPVSLPWPTTGGADGRRTITVAVRDAAGSTGTASLTLNVQNGGVVRVLITAPAEGATVNGTTWLAVWVENAAAGAKTFRLSEGGQTLASTTSTSNGPISLPWSTTAGANGTRSATVTVTDAAGHTATATRAVVVQNAAGGGTGTLRVFITQPVAGTTVHGTAWFTIWVQGAADGTKSYTLTQGGRTVAITTTTSAGPVSLPWSTGAPDNGARTATVSVRDAAGHTGTASVALTVAN